MDAVIRQSKFHDITHFGLRLAIGVIFIIHGSGKFNPGFAGFLTQIGVPTEMQLLLALAEFVPGILLVIGVLTRISGSILSLMMLSAIFYVKKATEITGKGGAEFEIMLLAGSLIIIVVGPGRVSLSHILKKVPRFLQ